MLGNNWMQVLIRGLIFLVLFKVFGKIAFEKIMSLAPNLRELLIFPFIAIRLIVVKLYELVKFYIFNEE